MTWNKWCCRGDDNRVLS